MGGAIAVHLSVHPEVSPKLLAMVVIDVVEGLVSCPIIEIFTTHRICNGCTFRNGQLPAFATNNIQIGAGKRYSIRILIGS